MITKLPVTGLATTAKTLDEVTVDNTLFVTVDPRGVGMGRVYWRGERVAGATVQAVSRGLVAIVQLDGQTVAVGDEQSFVYDGQELRRPEIDGFVFSLNVDHDGDTDTLTDF